MFRILLAFCMLSVPCSTSQAGLFGRIFGVKNVSSSSCPGGVCPTNQQWTNVDGLSARQHVEQVHGVSTAGMSQADIQQHQNDYHNTYGANHSVRGVVNAVVSVPRAGVRTVARAATYPARASSARASYGSAGSQTVQSYGSSGSQATPVCDCPPQQSYGSSGSLAVGQPDTYGYIVTSIGPIQQVETVTATITKVSGCPCGCPNCTCNQQAQAQAPAKPFELSNLAAAKPLDNLRARRAFKHNVLVAASAQVEDGSMSQERYNQLKFALNIPRIAREMEDAMKTQAVDDGIISGPLQDIDWEKLMTFIVKWLPVILKLFAAEDVQPVIINSNPYVSTLNLSYSDWFTAA